MNAVENAVSALDDGEVFITYLEELGRRHAPALMKKNMFAVSYIFHIYFAITPPPLRISAAPMMARLLEYSRTPTSGHLP